MSSSTSAATTPAIFKLSSPLFCSILGNHLSASDIAVGFNRTCRLFREIGRQEQIWKAYAITARGPPQQSPSSWFTHAKILHRMGDRFDKDGFDHTGTHRIHWCAEANDVEVLQWLLDCGVSVNLSNKSGLTPLHFASSSSEALEALELLIRSKADPNSGDHSALQRAASEGKVRNLQLLLSARADVNKTDSDGFSPLLAAVRWADYDLAVRTLLEAKADGSLRNSKGNALEFAMGRTGRDNSVRLLRSHAANLPLPDRKHIASLYDHDGYRNDFTSAGSHRIHMAASTHNVRVLRSLLDSGVDVNQVKADGSLETPLHDACFYAAFGAAKLLIERKADVEAANSSGWKPLYWCAIDGDLDVARLLIRSGVDLNCKTDEDETPLMRGAINGRTEFVRALLDDARTDATLKDRGGMTAAERAREGNHPQIQAMIEDAIRSRDKPSVAS